MLVTTIQHLPYVQSLAERATHDIDLAVIHCTELPDLKTAREYGERVLYQDGSGNSGHYYIDRDGCCEEWVDPLRVANHCRRYNQRSIGIELVNLGRFPNWLYAHHQTLSDPYPSAQIQALIALLNTLQAHYPVQSIAGHEDLDTEQIAAADDPSVQVFRKRDPGPLFPWEVVLGATSLRRIGAQVAPD